MTGAETILLTFLVGFCAVSVHSEPTWQSLRVTWGLNLLSSRTFAKMPQTENQARSDGFVRLAGDCKEGSFLGRRYMKGLDSASIIIYDVNGYVAGMQQGIPKSDVEDSFNKTTFDYTSSSAYVLDKILGEEEVYFLTSYFIEPSRICNGGRTAAEFEEEGVGTGLYLQNGTDPIRDSVEVPLYEKDMSETAWVKGGCFRTMGIHYWFKVSEGMSCRNFFPYVAIYNRGKLTSFAFVNFGKFEFSRRFEHPPESALSMFLPSPVPECISETYNRGSGFSTMHVFFSIRPWNVFC